MIITEFDNPLTAEDARKVALNNRDDSDDRYHFRELMARIREAASYGQTRVSTVISPLCRSRFYSEHVQNALRSMGYKVTEKKMYEWDEEKKNFSTEKPRLDHAGREQFFLEITWG